MKICVLSELKATKYAVICAAVIPSNVPMEQTLSIQKEKVEEASNEEFVRYAIDFDYSLVSVCHNKYLTDVFGNLIDLFTLVVLYEHETYGNDRYFHIKEHERILESVQSGDRDRTLHLILQHYNRQHL